MSLKDAVKPVEYQLFPADSLTNNYQLVSNTGLSAPCFSLRIVNASSAFVVFSFDGVTDHECLQTHTSGEVNLQFNSRPSSWVANASKGRKIWLRLWPPYAPVPLKGFIYIFGFTSNY